MSEQSRKREDGAAEGRILVLDDDAGQRSLLESFLQSRGFVVVPASSGEEALALIIDRLRSAGYGISFSGVNETVMEVFNRTHLLGKIGEQNIYPTMEKAILAVHSIAHQNSVEKECPLITVCLEAEEDILKGDELCQQ